MTILGKLNKWFQATPRKLIVLGLLAAFAGLATASTMQDSVTFDETAHLAAGLTYLDKLDFRLNPEHPPLAKVWAALPLWISGAKVDYSSSKWANGDQWGTGFEVLHGPMDCLPKHDPRTRLVPARLAMVLLGLVTALLTYSWSREMWGGNGALVSLLFFCFSPTMLAHTRLVHTDLAAAFGFLLTLWCFWRYARSPSWLNVMSLGGALGLALVMKLSCLLLVPMLGLLTLVWALHAKDGALRSRKRIVLGFGVTGMALAIAWVCIWLFYGFRYDACLSGMSPYTWTSLEDRSGFFNGAIRLARALKILPEGYLYGLHALELRMTRPSFMFGEISPTGFWGFFPIAFLLKTTPAVLGLIVWLSVTGLRSPQRRSFDSWLLITAIASYFAVAVFAGLNIGHRHLLPIYPFLFVLAGAAHTLFSGPRWRSIFLLVLLSAQVLSGLMAFPRYLSYFNLIAGGNSGGYRYLVDSNLDWGQDLPRLSAWMRKRGIERIYLAYFGTDDPRAYGIDYAKVHFYMDFHPEEQKVIPRSGDLVAISATLLQGLYVPPAVKSWTWSVRAKLQPIGRAGDSIFIYEIP